MKFTNEVLTKAIKLKGSLNRLPSRKELSNLLNISDGQARILRGIIENYDIINSNELEKENKIDIEIDKKKGNFDYDKWIDHLEETKKLKNEYSNCQNKCNINIKTDFDKIIIQPLSDLHIGCLTTDYRALRKFTDLILKYDNLYTCFIGDLVENIVDFKNKLTLHNQILNPKEQELFIESWIEKIKHKVLFSSWGNHEDFESRLTGRNSIQKIVEKNIVYFDRIGIANININDVNYQIIVNHRAKGSTINNRLNGLKKIARYDLPNGDIYIGGHLHHPAIEYNFERGKFQSFVLLSSLKQNDIYAQKNFSYNYSNIMPCLIMDSKIKDSFVVPTINNAITLLS